MRMDMYIAGDTGKKIQRGNMTVPISVYVFDA
jgi:hypothetical protein